MKTVLVAALATILLASLVQNADGLKCYTCDSVSQTNCGDPYSKPADHLTDCSSGGVSYGICMKTKTGNLVSRSCTPACVPIDIAGNSISCCSTDGCNGSERIILSKSIVLVSIIVSIFYFYL